MTEVEKSYQLIINEVEDPNIPLKGKLLLGKVKIDKQAYDSLQIHELLKVAGDNRSFQKMTLAILSCISFCVALSVYFLPFVFYRPKFFCFDQNHNATQCDEEVACANKFGFETRSNKYSSIDQFQIYCNRHYLEIYAKSLIFFGAAIPTLIVSILSDYFGRKPMIVGSTILLNLGSVLAFFASTFEIMVVGIIFMFIGGDIFFSITSIYTNEIIGSKIRNMGNGITYFFFGLGGITLFVLNIWIINYKMNFIIIFSLGVVCFILAYSLLETPYIHFKNDDLKMLYDGLCAINKANYSYEIELISENQKKLRNMIFQNKLSESEISQFSSIRINRLEDVSKNNKRVLEYLSLQLIAKICLLSVVFVNIYIGYGLSLLIPATLGIDNIYLNGILLGVSETFGYMIVTFNAYRIPRKFLNILNSSSTILFSLVLVYLSHFDTQLSVFLKQILQTAISVMIKLFLCMNFTLIFNYSAELVPTKTRGLVSGLTVFAGRISTTSCSFLVQIATNNKVHPMSIAALPSLLALPIGLILPETLGKPMPN